MISTVGIWTVKEGREEEFTRRWQEMADQGALDVPGTSFRLLRDHGNPRRYVSIAEGWHDVDQVERVRELPGYQDSLASIWRVLESGETAILELVAEIS